MIAYYVIMGVFTPDRCMGVSSRLKIKNLNTTVNLNRSGMSGAEIAMTMLQHYNIREVKW